MKHFYIILAVWLLNSGNAFAGDGYDWIKDRKRYTLSETEQKLNEYLLHQHTEFNYAVENGDLVCYAVFHRIILVNSEEAVNNHNTIEISMYNTLELQDVKARSISKSGVVKYFDKSQLKEIKNDNADQSTKVFAIEGIETGSEVEYFYVRKTSARIFDRHYTQYSVPVKHLTFIITSPAHLRFDFKSYNNAAEVTRLEPKENTEQNEYKFEATDIPPFEDEPFTTATAIRSRVEYKYSINTANTSGKVYTWDMAARTFFPRFNSLSKDDLKLIARFAAQVDPGKSTPIDKRIRIIESKTKAAIKVDKDLPAGVGNVPATFLKTRIANNEGITLLLYTILNQAGIPCDVGFTCSRTDVKFDGDFETWAYLDFYYLYIKDPEGYIAPAEYEERFPLLPYTWMGQPSLLIEKITVGDISTGSATVHEIPPASYELNLDNLDITVDFSEDQTSNKIHQIRTMKGYAGAGTQVYYDLVTETDRTNMVNQLIEGTAPDAKISTWKGSVDPYTGGGTFTIDATYESTHFIERAGNKLLFKAGLLIGPQSELYRDDKRTLPVDNMFNRGYERIIKINLPAGYKVKNVEDLSLRAVYEAGGTQEHIFESTAAVNGQVLTVSIKEYYKSIYVPVEKYEDFRKVINAAADFNKVTLVLEKSL